MIIDISTERETCRSLRGNVDRNARNSAKGQRWKVVPYVGTWIEIENAQEANDFLKSFPTWERG